MLHRTVCIASLLVLTLAAHTQVKNTQPQEPCTAGNCTIFTPLERRPVVPSHPTNNKALDFKPGDASVSCAVVRYELSQMQPILHLLCPSPEIYAPLYVHLVLTWSEPAEVPQDMKNMLVDSNSPAKFKSINGNARAELTLHDAQRTRSQKEWVEFTRISNVGLVLIPQK